MKALVDGESLISLTEKDNILIPEGNTKTIDLELINENTVHILVNGKGFLAELIEHIPEQKTLRIKIAGEVHDVKLKDPLEELMEKMGLDVDVEKSVKEIKAPMPGQIVEICVNEGDEIKKGDKVVILKAMKMENILKSPGSGKIKKIKVKEGDGVEKNHIMLVME